MQWRAAAVAIPILLLGTMAGAEGARLDSTIVHRFSLAPARGVNAETVLLPRAARVAWRVRLVNGIPYPPFVTRDGSIVIVHPHPSLSQYDAQGHLMWTVRLGAHAAATSAISLGPDLRGVFTQGGDVLWFSARGRWVSTWSSPLGPLDSEPLIAPLRDGGLLIAEGRRLARMDAAGGVVFLRHLPEESRALFELPSGLVTTLSSGQTLLLDAAGAVAHASEFGAKIGSVVAQGARLLAIVEGRGLVELDPSTGTRTQLLSGTTQDQVPLLIAAGGGSVRVLSNADLLIGLRANGEEDFRLALSQPVGPLGGRSVPGHILADRTGTTLVARADAEVLLASPDGSLYRTEGTTCLDPLRPSALPAQSVILACRSGTLLRLDDLGMGGSPR